MALSECTNQCHSQQHAADIIAMVTSSAPEEQVKTYLKFHCHHSGQVCDGYGRTALHVAASCGRAGLLEWLVKEEKADLQSKDQESGWTSLHRSIFYGQLVSAVKLIQLGASLKSCDFEDLTPLEVAVKDKPPHIDFSVDNPCDVYTWGSNSNFTLGHSNQQSRLSPDVVDEFLRVKVHIKQVVMNKYHTVVLAVNGRVFTCGHGQGGRLGQGKEETCLLPKMVKGLNGVCVFIAAARDQTLFQMEDGSVYGCGQNKFGQLGISPKEEKYLKPRQILGKGFANKDNVCMVAAKFHSVFFSSQEVFTCGLNAGQIGHAKSNQFISVPKLVTTLNHKNMEICHIAASDGVTACSTSNGDIYLLQNFVCRKIVNKQLNIAKIVVCGGTLDTGLEEIEVQGKSKAPVVMVILHKSGKVLSWQSSDETLRRCVSNRKRQIFFTDVTLSKQGLLLATTEGEAFKGHFTQKKTAPVFVSGTSRQGFIQIGGVEQVDKEKRELINIQHVPCLHRVAKVTCDPQGHNFAVLQNDPRMGLTEIPEVGPCNMETNLKMLLSEVSCADSIHDIEIKVGLQVYPAHKFILASRSDYFKRQLMGGDSQSTEEDVLTLEEEVHLNRNVTTIDMTTAVNADTLKRILTYLYTNSCDVFDWNFVENVLNSERVKFGTRQPTIKENQTPKSKGGKKKKKDKNTKEKNATETLDPDQQAVTLVVRQIKDAAKMFGIASLFQRLELVKMRDSRLDNFRPDTGKLSFDRFEFAELSDVILESDDEVLHHCHRCILVSRVEYFNSMLASSWLESSSTAPLQLPIPSSVMSILLDFVYTSTTPTLDGCTDMELVCNVLVTADQLLLPRLKEMTETVLVDMISLRNVSQLLEFASIYQAPQLKSSCQQFIGLNIVYLLESQSLDSLSDDVMVELTKAYREMIPGLSRRIITPYSNAPSSNDVSLLIEEVSEIDEVISRAKSRRKERRRSSERFSQSSESEVIHLSESIDEDKVSKTQTASSAEMRKVISTAKARRKERRRSSEKKNSERHSFVEEGVKGPPIGPRGEQGGNDRIESGGQNGSDKGVRLAVMFEGNQEKWMKVGKTGGKRRKEEIIMKDEPYVRGDAKPQVLQTINMKNEPSVRGDAKPQVLNDGPAHTADLKYIPEEQKCEQKNLTNKSSDVSTEKPPGDGHWLKKGQTVSGVHPPPVTPVKTPLHVSVHPWNRPPAGSVKGSGLKEIMAAEIASMSPETSGGHKKWSSGSGKKSKTQRRRDSQIKPEPVEPAKPAWGGWGKPASPPSRLEEVPPTWDIERQETLPTARMISFGDMFEVRRNNNVPTKTQNTTTSASPVSPQSPNQFSVWGLPDSSQRKSEPASPLSFTQILKAEEQAEKNLDKALNKSLHSIQIEEQAMEELLQMYQAEASHNEFITVEQPLKKILLGSKRQANLLLHKYISCKECLHCKIESSCFQGFSCLESMSRLESMYYLYFGEIDKNIRGPYMLILQGLVQMVTETKNRLKIHIEREMSN